VPQNMLIAYYSRSGNTRKIADLIYQVVGGTLYEIHPEVPYPNSYNKTLDRAKIEIRSGVKPPLQSKLEHFEIYDLIFVGSPNWWSTIAPPVATFLTEYDFSGKTIAPFCTHGGGGLDRIANDIAKLCPHSTLLESPIIYGSGRGNAPAEVRAWLQNIEIVD
jgi:flavodoxin